MGRSPCNEKKNELKKGPWTPEEDQKLIGYIHKHGYGNWRTLPKNAGLQRCGKSCRLRWTNYLRPDIKRGRFSFEEEETIIQLHSILGNKWSAIATRLPGRTDNEIKNYWNTHIRKRLLKMGIDPVTHNPRLDLLDISSFLNSSLYNTSPHPQPLVNQEILKLATSLFSTSQHRQNQTGVNQYQTNDPYNTITTQELQSCFPISPNQTKINQFAELNNISYQNMSTTVQDDSTAMYLLNHHNDFSSSNVVLDPYCSSDYGSILTTPSSSSTPLNSNSTTYINSSNCSINEDEKESYCSNNYMNFEIHDYSFGVNEFLQLQETRNHWD